VRPVTVHASISAPREEVFDYVADLANHVAFCDHYLSDVRLARARSDGPGAALRFRVNSPFGSQWAEVAVVEHDRPRRLVEEGRAGRVGRSRFWTVYDFGRESDRMTRVELTTWSEPASRADALRESLGARRWLRRQNKTALERLRRVFEEARDEPLARTTVAGLEPLKAPRFGARVQRPG
jgi:uncharacterized protein YndB with AHSA1/START domain